MIDKLSYQLLKKNEYIGDFNEEYQIGEKPIGLKKKLVGAAYMLTHLYHPKYRSEIFEPQVIKAYDFDAMKKNGSQAIFCGHDHCNDFCAIGQFGVFERAGQVYLRHNIILNLEDEMERIVTDICDYYSLVLASVDRFVDGLAQVATGVATLESAMDMGLFPTFNMEEEDNEMKL